ncbi:response regulator [Leptospira biflexa]|jgi:PleD family two-component response regulator|uniref:Response regulator n=3 Tax=Leptospira TaxID=171 RepID=A0ABY2M5G4_9LEPT|nr:MULTISPECIES: response regulator [Leptospira]ABZ94745.1 Receiver component of a two-component response regulator [Leptospira biflexa serovar Patoc strain 'Patoc 1 (Ames)']ABZ98413.1 Putative two-component response regulator [Leptospira biflexa serovar Patoc strain 'Patoc 1 (Paris)']EOQ87710.1 response regulator receiver domain protein [Leptospira yanagawae serovar Saopaulo str. Sao Paulo = ATCC 700523]TGL21893.1 response regulator [Leptospira yanagawae]TGM31034.1 response regulator [Leptosp
MQAGIGPTGRPYQILIAENSKFQSKQLQQILESEGFKIIGIAETGKELLKMYKENRQQIDLVTIEIFLPEVDGFAAFWDMKEMGVLPRILFISEENTPSVIKALLENGAMDYIVKPIKREKILEKIKETLIKIPKV